MSELEEVAVEKCDTCGQPKDECVQAAQSAMVDYSMMLAATKMLPPDYGQVLHNILIDWRTHTLPECNPLAVS